MDNTRLFSKLLSKINSLLLDEQFLCEHKQNSSDFKRKRKMDFRSIVLFILELPKKSLSASLDDFITSANLITDRISKQAFSKARQKIKSSLFRSLFMETTDIRHCRKSIKTWKDHPILAIDGTAVQLPNTQENRNYFGTVKNKYAPVAIANASILYDVLNDHIVNARITHYKELERDQAYELLNNFNAKMYKGKPILLFDRGYPSRELYDFIRDKRDLLFLMRAKSSRIGTLLAITESPLGDHTITYKWKEKEHFLRVIKFYLKDEQIETLVTNVFDPGITIEEFKELYFMRWGIETKYDEIKNIFRVEKFTGIKPITIEQDFYAHMLVSNLVAIVKVETDEKIYKEIETSGKKTMYRTNRDYLASLIVKNLFLLITKRNKRKKEILKIIVIAQKNRSQVRPNRSCERKSLRNRRKYTMNKKSSM